MKFRQQLINLRAEYDLTQADVARMAGVTIGIYQTVERGHISKQSASAIKVRKNVLEDTRAIEEHFERKRRVMDQRRIPNIPKFYERLESICDEDGHVCEEKNPEVLESLQEDLGVGASVPENDSTSKGERKRFADLLKEYRGDIPKTEFSRRLGITMASYNAIETEIRSSNSDVMRGLLVNAYFTKHQQRQLQRVYDRMAWKEMQE